MFNAVGTIRISLLAVMLSGGLLVLGKAIVTPKTSNAAVATNSTNQWQWPASVPIKDWQPLPASPIKSESGAVLGQKYPYQQGSTSLDVELRYEAGDGNVSRFLFVHTPIRAANANLQIKYQAEVGFYGVLAHEGRAYLSSCINPRGGSTVTEHQFTENRYRYDLQVGRVLPWVLGQESLLDRRCLWTLMSTPLKEKVKSGAAASESEAFKTLETAWVSWHQWWQGNFPSTQALK